MSQLYTNQSSFGGSRAWVQHEYPLKRLYVNLRVLATSVFPAFKSKNSDLGTEQLETAVTESQCNSRIPDTVQGCRAYMNDAEFQRHVELGHWHHRRQRRRSRLR